MVRTFWLIMIAALSCVLAPAVFGQGTVADQAHSNPVEPGVISPAMIEETLPEERGVCTLRMTASYRAVALQPPTALRAQVFCGVTSRFGMDVSAPLGRSAQAEY